MCCVRSPLLANILPQSGQTYLDTAIEACSSVGEIIHCGGGGGGIVDCGGVGGSGIVDSGGGECEGGGCMVTWEGIEFPDLDGFDV